MVVRVERYTELVEQDDPVDQGVFTTRKGVDPCSLLPFLPRRGPSATGIIARALEARGLPPFEHERGSGR